MPIYNALSFTEPDQASVFGELQRWCQTWPHLSVVSVAFASDAVSGGVTAVVSFTQIDKPNKRSSPVETTKANYANAVTAYFHRRLIAGAHPDDISGPEAAEATGAAESTARNILAQLRRDLIQAAPTKPERE